MNWGEAKKAATGFIHRRDIDWDMVQPLAHDDIAQRLMIQEMEDATTLSPGMLAASPFYYCQLPTAFARARSVTHAYDDGFGTATPFGRNHDMQPVPSKTFRSRMCGPDSYTILGGRLWTYGAGAVELVYTRRLDQMVEDDDTNPVLEGYSAVYIYALCKHGAAFSTDFDASDKFEAMFDQAVGSANENYTSAILGSGMAPISQGGIV